MKRKIYVVGGDTYYASWIDNSEIVNTLESADIVLFTGGEDVHPILYGEEKLSCSYTNFERDKKEVIIYEKALELGIYMLGICRGSQFLCAMNKGKLIQNVASHSRDHLMTDKDNNEYRVVSTHHQMMYPYLLDKKDYELIGYSKGLSNTYSTASNFIDLTLLTHKEPEIVYFNKSGCLCIQAHPEMDTNEENIKYYNSLFNEYYIKYKKSKLVIV